jgi:hypothetical protein
MHEQRPQFGAFTAPSLPPAGQIASAESEEFSTSERFAYLPRPRGLLARMVRIVNTAILGEPQAL